MNKLRKTEDSQPQESQKPETHSEPQVSSNIFETGKNFFGKFGDLMGKGNEKKLEMRDQDYELLRHDLSKLETLIPDRKDITNKVRILIGDNIRLKEMLAESNKVNPETSHLDNLLLAQVLEYERDSLDSRKPSVQATRANIDQSSIRTSISGIDERKKM